MSESPRSDAVHTKAFDQVNRAYLVAQDDIYDDLEVFPFPRPKVGHICERCSAIPAELFLATSVPICVGKHTRADVCRGAHELTCDSCKANIEDGHFHCMICHRGDYDVCEKCVASGKLCLDENHPLSKRFILKGLVVDNLDECDGDRSATSKDRKVEKDITTGHNDSETSTDGPPPALHDSLQPYLLHPSLASLLASAAFGCHSCSVVTTWLSSNVGQKVPEDAMLFVEPRYLELPPSVVFAEMLGEKILVDGREPGPDELPFQLVPSTVLTYGRPNEDRPTLCPLIFQSKGRLGQSKTCIREPPRRKTRLLGIQPRQIAPTLSDINSLKVVSGWIKRCTGNHAACSQWPQERLLPKRLIDVSSTDDPGVICLVASDELLERNTRYLTLSYCWGRTSNDAPWLTKKDRFAAYEKKIQMNDLPKTIYDAVIVVRAIGERYLWVDSLCIVQNDEDEWAQEAQKMGGIYLSSLCTLIAGTDSSSGGLLIDREPLKVSAATLLLNSASGLVESQNLTLFPKLPDGEIHRGGPTANRGWCLQEEMLSPRRLYFTPYQLIWECLCAEWKETGVVAAGDDVDTSYTPPLYRTDTALASHTTSKEWFEILQEYTSRNFTYYKDIFPALSGIAKQLQKRYMCKYIAGMWLNDVQTGLLWRRVSRVTERPSEYSAPSWSWLSVKGRVLFNRGSRQETYPDAEVIDCHATTENGDEFGLVTSGHLALRARLLTCIVIRDVEASDEKHWNTIQSPEMTFSQPDRSQDEIENESKDEPKPVLRSGPWEAFSSFKPVPDDGNPLLTARLSTVGTNPQTFATIYFDGEEEAQHREIYCAFVAETRRPGDLIDRNGIALIPALVAEDEKIGMSTYRRVGFVAFWDKVIGKDPEFLRECERTKFGVI